MKINSINLTSRTRIKNDAAEGRLAARVASSLERSARDGGEPARPIDENLQAAKASHSEQSSDAEAEPSGMRVGSSSSPANTSISLYLREIGKVKLLTPDEEIELANRIKQGDKKAREQMIKANLRLVVKIARDYEGIGLPLLDLISEGNMGLMKAVERFDPRKGAKLSTYGAWWIKQSMKRALANQSKTIRLPVHMVDKISKMRRASVRLEEVLGREPTDQELAEDLDITSARVASMRMASTCPSSLDASIGDDDSSHFADVVADEKAVSPYDDLEDKTIRAMLTELLGSLKEREIEILRGRFGLDGGRRRSLEELAQDLGITRERVRQLQNNALKKLRGLMEKRQGHECQLV